ncbi:hypothetical protein CERZMDRAFT_88083 [Cercospora zeae-maydis SCOH1-5]|uniref:Uncharacterized protein n=1 Tax=Cercospora zeae-maydis SCOH1-5 TaxID=717836 RepID=A0A6A6F6N8_9PEZI|nr:hypothetical protein CERZMDRAFT_88083 [Cercospora zeae-maydis SCOH1-5]
MPCLWSESRSIAMSYMETSGIQALPELTGAQLNTLYDQLIWSPAASTPNDEVQNKKNLIAWLQRNLPHLKKERKMPTMAIINASMALRDGNAYCGAEMEDVQVKMEDEVDPPYASVKDTGLAPIARRLARIPSTKSSAVKPLPSQVFENEATPSAYRPASAPMAKSMLPFSAAKSVPEKGTAFMTHTPRETAATLGLGSGLRPHGVVKYSTSNESSSDDESAFSDPDDAIKKSTPRPMPTVRHRPLGFRSIHKYEDEDQSLQCPDLTSFAPPERTVSPALSHTLWTEHEDAQPPTPAVSEEVPNHAYPQVLEAIRHDFPYAMTYASDGDLDRVMATLAQLMLITVEAKKEAPTIWNFICLPRNLSSVIVFTFSTTPLLGSFARPPSTIPLFFRTLYCITPAILHFHMSRAHKTPSNGLPSQQAFTTFPSSISLCRPPRPPSSY